MGNDAVGVCSSVGQVLDQYRAVYEERWGRVDMDGWTLRVRSTTLMDRAAGATWWDERLIEVEPHMLDALPHELHHVQLGPSSDGHRGWCLAYYPWERATLGLDEGAYLGCAR